MATLRDYKKHPGWQREYRVISQVWTVAMSCVYIVIIGWLTNKDSWIHTGLVMFAASGITWTFAAMWTAWRWKDGIPKDVQKDFPSTSS